MNPMEEVIAAEKEAEKIIKKAEEKKLAMVSKAKQDALQYLSDQQKVVDREQETIVKKKTEELERKKEKIRAEAQTKISQISRTGESSLPKAKDFILKQFEERLQ